MRRADTPGCAAAIALVALGGCMKIYPDSELPDIEVEWFAELCSGDEELTLSLTGLDDPAFRSEVKVPCSEGTYTFADVARRLYLVQGRVLTADALWSSPAEGVDLRNGLDQRPFLYLSAVTNVSVMWTFAMDADCISLGAESVAVAFTSSSLPAPIERMAPCMYAYNQAWIPDGVYTVVARALRGETPVAVSPPSPPVTISADTQTDVGPLVLTPCGERCDVPTSSASP